MAIASLLMPLVVPTAASALAGPCSGSLCLNPAAPEIMAEANNDPAEFERLFQIYVKDRVRPEYLVLSHASWKCRG